MPLYLDTHQHVAGLTAEAVAAAHARDVEIQSKYSVTYFRYWFDEVTGRIFCLFEAPDAEADESAFEGGVVEVAVRRHGGVGLAHPIPPRIHPRPLSGASFQLYIRPVWSYVP